MKGRPHIRVVRTIGLATAVAAFFLGPITPAQAIHIELDVAKAGSGGGTVTSVPSGINCGSDCHKGNISTGDVIALSAVPNASSSFGGWQVLAETPGTSGGCGGLSGFCTLTFSSGDENTIIQATFNALTPGTGTLTTSKSGTGTGSVVSTDGLINCNLSNADCGQTYTIPTAVTLSAAPGPGSSFGGWSVAGSTGTTPGTPAGCGTAGTCSFVVHGTVLVNALFNLVALDSTCGLPGVLCGTNGNDVLRAGPGGVTILGFGGDDTCVGGSGPDTINCGAGDDVLKGGLGSDNLTSTSGADVLIGGAGPDNLHSGAGPDTLVGGNGNDSCLGGAGRDTEKSCESN